MLSFKFTGIILVFLAGVFTTYEVKTGFDKRIAVLRQIEEDIEFFIGKISYFKIPVNSIIEELMKKKENKLSDLYNALSDYFISKDKLMLKEKIYKLKLDINSKDREFLYETYLSIGNHDYENEIKNLSNRREIIKSIIDKAEQNKIKNQKTRCTLTMCSFILIIIFFI